MIGKYSIIEENVFIGNNVVIDNYVIIKSGSVIGDDVKIGNYCEIRNGVNIMAKSVLQGRVRIAENCFIGKRVTLKYGTILTANTAIGDDVFIGPNVIFLGPIKNDNTYLKNSKVTGKVFVGAGTKIAHGVNITAPYVTVGTMSFVNKDITEPGTYIGIPARKRL